MQVSGWWASHLQPASVEATLSSMTAPCVLPRYKRWCLSGGVKGNGEQEPQALGCLIWHVPLSYKPRTGLFATALGARRPSVGHEKNPSALWPSLRTTALKPLLLDTRGFPDSSVGKESACNERDPGSIPGSGRSTGEGIGCPLQYSWASLMVKACNAGDLGSVPGLGRSPGKGKGYPLQYSGLENSMDCIVDGVPKSRTGLSVFHFLDT